MSLMSIWRFRSSVGRLLEPEAQVEPLRLVIQCVHKEDPPTYRLRPGKNPDHRVTQQERSEAAPLDALVDGQPRKQHPWDRVVGMCFVTSGVASSCEIVAGQAAAGTYLFDIWPNEIIGVYDGLYNGDAELCPAPAPFGECFVPEE